MCGKGYLHYFKLKENAMLPRKQALQRENISGQNEMEI